MKRIILLSISLTLIVSCFYFHKKQKTPSDIVSYSSNNESILNLNDFNSFFDFLKNDTSGDSASQDPNDPTPLSTYSIKDNTKYTSATATIVSYLEQSQEYYDYERNGVKKFYDKQKLNRTMTMYVDEEVTLYDTKGLATYEKKWEELQYGDMVDKYYYSSVVFDMMIFVNETDAYTYIRDLTIITSEKSYAIKGNYTMCWIKLPFEFVESLIGIDFLNRSFLETTGEIISFVSESSSQSKNSQEIELNEYDLKAMYEEHFGTSSSFLDNYKCEIDIHLSKPHCPSIVYTVRRVDEYDEYDEAEENGYAEVDKLVINEDFVFTNINTTNIRFDTEYVEASVKDEKEFEKLFNSQKRYD